MKLPAASNFCPAESATATRSPAVFAHSYPECVHLAMYVAAKAREGSHHPDMLITWQPRITTHDVGRKLTELDFDLAQYIDRIAEASGATPVDGKI